MLPPHPHPQQRPARAMPMPMPMLMLLPMLLAVVQVALRVVVQVAAREQGRVRVPVRTAVQLRPPPLPPRQPPIPRHSSSGAKPPSVPRAPMVRLPTLTLTLALLHAPLTPPMSACGRWCVPSRLAGVPPSTRSRPRLGA